MIRTYSTLISFKTFDERFEYLRLFGSVGKDTFGFDRYLNQQFYKSKEWRDMRNRIIVRDNGCDLAMPEHEICGLIYIHHMNPITIQDIDESSDYLLNPEYLICVSKSTHDLIHYGNNENISMYKKRIVDRTPGDTLLWKK